MIELYGCDKMIEFIEINIDVENKQYKNIVDKVMMNYDIDYNYIAYKYNEKKLENKMKNEKFKVYIIYISENTLEIIKIIREILDDWQSMIIAITDIPILKKEILEKGYLLIDCIGVNEISKLKKCIQISMKNYDQRPNSIKYYYKKNYYNIEYRKIIYIEKELDNKRCIIHTQEKQYYIQKNLKNIQDLLDNRFIKCNRSFIINIEQMEFYDTKRNIIHFKNNICIDSVSREKKKEILNYFRRVNQ